MAGRSEAGKKRLGVTSIHIPVRLLEEVDKLVERGLFASRSEAFRFAVVLLLREMHRLGEERQKEVGLR